MDGAPPREHDEDRRKEGDDRTTAARILRRRPPPPPPQPPRTTTAAAFVDADVLLLPGDVVGVVDPTAGSSFDFDRRRQVRARRGTGGTVGHNPPGDRADPRGRIVRVPRLRRRVRDGRDGTESIHRPPVRDASSQYRVEEPEGHVRRIIIIVFVVFVVGGGGE